MKIKLHVRIKATNGSSRELELEFSKAEILIGRNPDSDVKIPSDQVSRQHAKIFLEGNNWKIQDLKSSLGTRVNGQTITDVALLKNNDKIEISQTIIKISFLGVADILGSTADERTCVVAQKIVQDIFANSQTEENQPYFRVMNGEHEGAKIAFSRESEELILGREFESDLRLLDKSISRKHARVFKDWNTYLIENLDSKNGLVVNGHSVNAPIQLNDSDEVFLGKVHLVFHEPIAEAIGAIDSSEVTTSRVTISQNTANSTIREEEPVNSKPNKRKKRKPGIRLVGPFEFFLLIFAGIVIAGLFYGISQYYQLIIS